MATRVPAPEELLCMDELEGKLTNLSERVELKKEEVRSNFQQFQDLLFVRENFVLKEMEDIVTLARQEVAEKRFCSKTRTNSEQTEESPQEESTCIRR